MPAYRFEAVNTNGTTERGVVDADSARQARTQLRARGLTPISVETVGQAARAAAPARKTMQEPERAPRRNPFAPRLKTREQALVTRQLASLLSAGLPLDEALAALADQAERPYVREVLAAIRADVLGGNTLAASMAAHPYDFAPIYRALVAAGEQTGKLGLVMEKLADYVETRNALTQKISLAFTYPIIVTVVAMAIVTFLLTYVVPQVVSVFANSKQKLPLLTVMMLALSDFIRHWGWLALLCVIGTGWMTRRALQQPALRLAWHTWLLDAPLAGKLILGYNTARFASTLAILTNAGVPILRALQAAGDTLNNMALRANVEDATMRVREGSPLGRALAAQNRFPPVLVHLIRSGETTGRLPQMLDRAAAGETQELERRTMLLTNLLEPLLILAMGGIVMLIVLAVLMPIIEINQLIR